MHKSRLIYIFVIFLFVFFSFSTIGYANIANISVDHLNVRSGPGTEFEVITKVHSNEKYPIIQEQGDWIEIQLEQMTGWITKEYVTIEDTDTDNNESPSIHKIIIPVDHTQIRSGPSIKDEISYFAKKGETYDIISEKADWYEIKNGDKSGYIHKKLTVKSALLSGKVLEGKTFVIDAGHGGYDVGAISVSGVYEKDLTYVTAIELKNALDALGANVILTRENDEYIRLGSRVSVSNLVNPDLFISIHYNSFPDAPDASGVVSYYYDETDKELASLIQEQTVSITQARDRDSLYENLLVLRHNSNKSVLLELGFISNVAEEQLLLTDQYQKKLVKGIINGIVKYYSMEKSEDITSQK